MWAIDWFPVRRYMARKPEMSQILRGLRSKGRGGLARKSSAVHFSLTEETP